jgi:signal peptidase II
MKKNTNSLPWLWLSVLIIILDQMSKLLVLHFITFNQPIAITPFFNLVLAHNPGAAFSFLAQQGGWQGWLFGIIAILVSGCLIYWLYKLPSKQTWLAIALALIIGGALGNLCDRVIHGYVIDFLDFYIGNWHWPAFNLADSTISIGAVMLIVDAIWYKHPKTNT